MSSFKKFQGLQRQSHLAQCNIWKFLKSEHVFREDDSYIVIWYGRIIPGPNGGLRIEVHFVNQNVEFYAKAKIPLDLIPKIPLGSVWVKGVCTSKLAGGDIPLVTLRDVGSHESLDTNLVYRNLYDSSEEDDFWNVLKTEYHIAKHQEGKERVNKFLDRNTLLTIPIRIDDVKKTLIIHPLTFLQAHYGVSKNISNILLGRLWGGVEEGLHLKYENPSNPDAVFIPDNFLVADAVFLYYLKNDSYTKNIVMQLNARVRQNLTRNKNDGDGAAFSYLKVRPYHSQPVHITCNYIEINDQVLLCTEITGISMPQGEKILYDIDRPERKYIKGCIQTKSYTIKPIFHDINEKEVMLLDETANNRNTAVFRQQLQTLGDAREIARNSNISLDVQLRIGHSKVVDEPLPEGYTDGHRVGAGGNVGMLKVILEGVRLGEKDEFGITGFDSQYQRLLKYAQHLKQNASSHGYHEVKIDCCDKLGERQGEIVEPIVLNKGSFPRSVYILRLQFDSSIYYFLDCESRDKQSSSGVVVKVLNEEKFLLDWDRGYTLKILVSILKDNYGRLQQSVYDEVGVNGVKASNITVAKYKHMNEETSDWVLSGLGKFV